MEDPEKAKDVDEADGVSNQQAVVQTDTLPDCCLCEGSIEQKWLLMGTFAATRKVIIFTDSIEAYQAHLKLFIGQASTESEL
mmetsp:Transcript_26972/g.36056  ORF Transcript_26972/g.36056 Transcript_26972/m.36056 type:complete len:82 (+) Transcript_26972:139-384(+)|eukprot:CAMPEP_0185576272 /NCGR_PEP_ID=MMETSP0434-20130131/7234_1 /TAXON_ID=626734 ORGANISM="Favella taraikaensis, Strain Fe Narragansett Bay" /NCGR_SAMPLE_ID=MMETSP0434 /ASSEMBLY_ACC=CAM_ASM_000379 /LENGTH=81 /DNA_ID=CAMNT_0028193403 /DNA_START=137 /DNA_END=382 /DNA_ORIENTATION=+